MATKYIKEVETTIASVMKGREVKREDAITYMLGVATGRLHALKRYAGSLPEGKSSKGILAPKGSRKRAERTASVAAKVRATVEAETGGAA